MRMSPKLDFNFMFLSFYEVIIKKKKKNFHYDHIVSFTYFHTRPILFWAREVINQASKN